MQKSNIKELEKTARALAEGASAETRNAIETVIREARKYETVRESNPVRLPLYLKLALCLAALITALLLIVMR